MYFAASRDDAAYAGFDDSYIYKQIPLNPSERDLKSQQFMQSEAVKVFKLWNESDQKHLIETLNL